MDRILTLNGLQEEWPLQIGQKLVISPGNITPSPTLSNIQKLTPEVDGNYYHTVQSGETLSWIADLYDVPLADLMAWNGLNNTSVIRPEQKLLLLVTPPAMATATQSPTTIPLSPSPSTTANGNPACHGNRVPVPKGIWPESYFRCDHYCYWWIALVEIFTQKLELLSKTFPFHHRL